MLLTAKHLKKKILRGIGSNYANMNYAYENYTKFRSYDNIWNTQI